MKNTIFIILISLLTPFISMAAGSIGTSGAAFLELTYGSRAKGLGDAFTAGIQDINAFYFNPASLGTLKYPVISIEHQELIVDTRYDVITGAFKIGKGFMAISSSVFWIPPMEKIDINGLSTGYANFVNGTVTVAYGYDFGFIKVGASAKYVYQVIDTAFLQAASFDLGILTGMHLYTPFKAPIKNFWIGFSVLNIGTPVMGTQYTYDLPRQIRLGLFYKLTNWFGIYVDMTESLIQPEDIFDFTYGFDESFNVNLGVEFTYLELLSLRAGYRFNDGGTFTVGLGFNYTVGNVTFIVDAAYGDSGIFGPSYSFNLTFKLIPSVITSEAKDRARRHYNLGIKYYITNDLDAALAEFRKCKFYNPYYKNIDDKIRDLEQLKKLKKENKKLDEELKKKQQNKKN